MKQQSMVPNIMTYNALISAYNLPWDTIVGPPEACDTIVPSEGASLFTVKTQTRRQQR